VEITPFLTGFRLSMDFDRAGTHRTIDFIGFYLGPAVENAGSASRPERPDTGHSILTVQANSPLIRRNSPLKSSVLSQMCYKLGSFCLNITHTRTNQNMSWLVRNFENKQLKEKVMNNTMTGVVGETAKAKSKLKKRHFYLVVSQVAIAAFVMGLAHYASREALLAGLCGLATLTMMVAFAAFFRAYVTD
jgi:hypothetical protein